MDPNPLPWIRANEFFDFGSVERSRIDDVFLGVAGAADSFDELTDKNAVMICIPDATNRNNDGVGAQGKHRDGAGGAGKMAEKWNKNTIALQRVYVCEKAETATGIEDGEALQN